MKAILISIRPQWVAKILNGEKTIEVRKHFPKDYIGWVYIYCTKDKKYANLINRGGFLTGMVVARFWCDKVEKINAYSILDTLYETTNIKEKELLKVSCLTYQELNAYLKHKIGYAIHITNLEIFDKPKEIKEFRQWFDCEKCWCVDNQDCLMNKQCPKHKLTRAPESYCYIEIE